MCTLTFPPLENRGTFGGGVRLDAGEGVACALPVRDSCVT